MPDATEAGEIVVVGERPNRFVEVEGSGGGAFTNLMPRWWTAANPSVGLGGLDVVVTQDMLANANIAITPAGMNFQVLVSQDEWAKMPKNLQTAIEMVLRHAILSNPLTAALAHIDAANPTSLIIRVDTVSHHYNGQVDNFSQNNPLMNISYDSGIDASGTFIKPNSTIIININESRLASATNLNVEAWADSFIHEIFHPFIADINGNDHDRVVPAAAQAVKDLFLINYEKTLGADAQKAIFGSRFGDALNGGDNDDSIAGMEGNDLLSGGLGSNLLYGGVGLDHLIASGVNDLLEGGLEADVYTIGETGFSPFVREDGGVDRIELEGALANYSVTRYGDSLLLSTIKQGRGHEIIIEEWFQGDAHRIEMFAFADGTYAASYLEYLAEGQTNGCYDEFGRPILCGVSATPIVLDLQGDGVSFIEAEHSGVRMDVDRDGVLDKVGWITRDDALLLFDRNGDGQFTDFSELTFTGDMLGAASDLEGLLAHDADRDGFITASDAIFDQLLIWVDGDMNGRSADGEIASLQQHGITGFDLEIMSRVKADRDASTSQILGWSDVKGSTSAVAVDAAFRFIADKPSCGCTGARIAPEQEAIVWETYMPPISVSEYLL